MTMTKQNARDIYTVLSNRAVSAGTVDVVADFLRTKNMNEDENRETAERICAAVTQVHELRQAAGCDTSEAVEVFFSKLDGYSQYERCCILDKAIFGFENGHGIANKDELHSRYLDACKSNHFYCSSDEGELKQRYRDAVMGINLSPKQIRRFAKLVRENADVTATAAAFGAESCEMKCLCAASYYIDNKMSVTPEGAANTVCASIDVQAVADAVHRGEMTEQAALNVLSVIIYSSLLAGCIFLGMGFPGFFIALLIGDEVAIGTFLAMSLIGGFFVGLWGLGQTMADMGAEKSIGRFAAGATFFSRDKDGIADGLDSIADAAEDAEEQYENYEPDSLQGVVADDNDTMIITAGDPSATAF